MLILIDVWLVGDGAVLYLQWVPGNEEGNKHPLMKLLPLWSVSFRGNKYLYRYLSLSFYTASLLQHRDMLSRDHVKILGVTFIML